MELNHKYEGGWILTDDASTQYVRQVGHDAFELIEIGRHGPDGCWYEAYTDTIMLSCYEEAEINTVLRCFGYQDVDAVREEYKTAAYANQIIAECLFEHYGSNALEPLCCGVSETEAIKAVVQYMEAHNDPQKWENRIVLSQAELAQKIAALELDGELTFYDAEEEDSYGVTRRRFFEADVIIINYFGGGNPYIIDVEWQGEAEYQHILHGLNDYLAESDIDAVYMLVDSEPADDDPLCEEARQIRDMDRSKLLGMKPLLGLLDEGGRGDDVIAELRDVYHKQLGFDPIWRQHLGDGVHYGAVIVPVAEGFLSIPYDVVDEDVMEIYAIEDAALLTAEAAEYLLELTTSYMEPYTAVLRCIASELREMEGVAT